jgi:hypothetical protein
MLRNSARRESTGIFLHLIQALCSALLLVACHPHWPPVILTGAVLIQDTDPRKQMPVPNTIVTADSGDLTVQTKTDSTGFFRVTLPSTSPLPSRTMVLSFKHDDYKPLRLDVASPNQIFVVHLVPIRAPVVVRKASSEPAVPVTDLRVRYSIKAAARVDVGAQAKTFEVVNTSNVPCKGHPPCSPDGLWKATLASTTLDAGKGNEFRDDRVSCIAGPCPFTHVVTEQTTHDGRMLTISALDWSDTATFLIEAEVTKAMINDAIRVSIPIIFGQAVNFTLPPTAEGPSIEADLGKQDIIFPLGPEPSVPWATCTVKINTDRSQLYQCELKPGYHF